MVSKANAIYDPPTNINNGTKVENYYSKSNDDKLPFTTPTSDCLHDDYDSEYDHTNVNESEKSNLGLIIKL